jgi:hypothetical protein
VCVPVGVELGGKGERAKRWRWGIRESGMEKWESGGGHGHGGGRRGGSGNSEGTVNPLLSVRACIIHGASKKSCRDRASKTNSPAGLKCWC